MSLIKTNVFDDLYSCRLSYNSFDDVWILQLEGKSNWSFSFKLNTQEVRTLAEVFVRGLLYAGESDDAMLFNLRDEISLHINSDLFKMVLPEEIHGKFNSLTEEERAKLEEVTACNIRDKLFYEGLLMFLIKEEFLKQL